MLSYVGWRFVRMLSVVFAVTLFTFFLLNLLPGSPINAILGPAAGDPAARAELNSPHAVATDAAGNVYIADTANNVVRKVASNGTVSTLAGNGTLGNGGDGGAATSAQLNGPQGVAVDSSGNVYIADSGNSRVRKVTAAGTIGAYAGTGAAGFGGDDGAAASAQLNSPTGVAVDSAGNLYIADFENSVIRKVTAAGAISTIAGVGPNEGYSGDGGPATKALLNFPESVAVDSAGNVYIADQMNCRVRMVTASGVISTIAGTGSAGYSGDGGPAIGAAMTPVGIAADSAGSVYVSDGGSRVRRFFPGGGILAIAGNGAQGYTGDGGIATSASLNAPNGLAVDSKGDVFVADTNNNAIRELVFAGSGNLTIAAVTNGATNLTGAISAGEVLVLYGAGLGPSGVATNSPNANGVYGASVGGVTVYVDGIPAPILYSSAGQVSILVPFGVQGSQAQIYVSYNGQSSVPVTVQVAPATPSLFTLNYSGSGQVAAINQDATGTVNGPANPASSGEYVSLYGTGGGALQIAPTDGLIASGPDYLSLPVSASINGIVAPVSYAGAAPGSPYGVMQVNVQIPPGLSAGPQPLLVTVGGVSTQPGVTISVSGK